MRLSIFVQTNERPYFANQLSLVSHTHVVEYVSHYDISESLYFDIKDKTVSAQ